MKIRFTLITSLGIIVLTLLSVSIGNANPDSVGTTPLTDDILRSKAAFAIVEEEIAHHLNLDLLTERDYQKIRGSVFWKIRAPIHSKLREQFGKIVDTVDFGPQLDAGSPSQSPPTNRGDNKPVLHKKAAEIIRDFINREQLSVIIGSQAPIGIGETVVIRGLRGEVRYTYDVVNGACVIIPIKNLTALIKRPFITEIWPNAKGNLKLQDSVPKIGADKVHDAPPTGLGVTGKGVRVAVVDSGIDVHKDFGVIPRVVAHRFPVITPNPDSHGTHVAGIIGAAAAADDGVTGVAPEVLLLDAQVSGLANLVDQLFGFEAVYGDVVKAIEWAVKNNPDVINMSLGWNVWDYGRRGDDKMSELIDTVVSNGDVFVMSAGNEGKQRATGDFTSDMNASIILPPHSFSVYHPGEDDDFTTVDPVSSVETYVILLWETELIDLDLMLYDSNNQLIATSFTPTSLHPSGHFYYERIDFTSETANQHEVDYQVRVIASARENGPQNYEIWGGSDHVSFDNLAPARTLSVPGYSKKVITVGGLIDDWRIRNSSSHGPTDIGLMKPEVVAPGTSIRSTVASFFGNKYDEYSGTSMAAPHVAGVAALILDAVGKNSHGEWNFSPDEVKSAIVRGAERGFNFIPKTPDNTYGAGLVKADNIIFGGIVPDQGELRFEITPQLLGSRFGSYFLNAENTYPVESRAFLNAAISWVDSKHNLDIVLSDANGKVLGTSNQAQSNYEKISAQLSPLPGVSYYLVVTNRSNQNVTFTGAATHPIKPATRSIPITPESTSLADIVLIIDSSSSMQDEDPGNLRKSGAELFIESADPEVQIAIVDFHGSARRLVPLTFADTTGKITLKNAVDRVHSSGASTNIDAGLQQGFQELQASTSSAKKAAVLLTDGQDDVARQVISNYTSQGWPIYTIGLGSGVKRRELERIAQETGGEYFEASHDYHIQTVYSIILAKTTGKSTLAKYVGYIKKGQQITKDVSIDDTVDQVDISCNWQGSTIELVLIDPNGTRITPQGAAANPRITYKPAATYAIYTLENPKQGKWQIQATGTDIPPQGEPFNLTVNATSDFSTNFLSFDSSYTVGETIQIGIDVQEKTGDTFATVLGATTAAKVVRPDGRIDTLNLYDDGSHDDRAANDGIYANTYRSVDKQGTYLIQVSAENGFSREIQAQVVVGSIDNVFIDGSTITPAVGATLKQAPSVISAVISGPAGRINANSIVLKVDGRTVSHTYNRMNQLVSYRPGGLSGGSHNMQLSVRDTSGNAIETAWQFTISSSIVTTAHSYIYWTNHGTRKIQRSNLDGTNVEDLVTTGLRWPQGIALDVSGSKIYWADAWAGKIQRSNLDGTDVENLVTGLPGPAGIALDVSGGKMYWADERIGKIQRSNLDGTGVQDLVTGLGKSYGIALDVSGGKIYWTGTATTRKIQRSNLDGSDVQDLITGLPDPHHIALDVSGGKMYWADIKANKIQCSNLNGTGVEDLVSTGLDGPDGIALDVSSGKIYWSDWGTDKIQRSNLDGSGVEDFITGIDGPGDIALDVSGGSTSPKDLTNEQVIFSEDWESGAIDTAKWIKYGSPLPRIVNSFKGYSNVFDNNGDPNHASGALTVNPIHLPSGEVTISADVYVEFSNLSGCWATARIGLTEESNPTTSNTGFSGGHAIYFELSAVGDACWAAPADRRRKAWFGGSMRDATGNREGTGGVSIDGSNYVNGWHKLRIVIDASNRVSFYVDNTLLWQSTGTLDPNVRSGKKLDLGERSSGSAGKAYIDNIEIRSGSQGAPDQPSPVPQENVNGHVLFSDDFSSGNLNKWTPRARIGNRILGENCQSMPWACDLTVESGALKLVGIQGGNYSVDIIKDIFPTQNYSKYVLSFDWKSTVKETPYGISHVSAYFYNRTGELIGQMLALNTGFPNRTFEDHGGNLVPGRYGGVFKVHESFDWERVTLDTATAVPRLNMADVHRIHLRAEVYNDAGSGGDLYVDNLSFIGVSGTPQMAREDVNGDGVVDIQDTTVVIENWGQTGENAADVNEDGIVDVEDLVLVLAAIEDAAGAPALYTQALTLFTAEEVQQWLIEARGLADKSPAHRRGVLMLEQLLALLTPKETALLPNYPNPFNPETWIPYRLAVPAEVTLTIYAVNGSVVRTLALGHQAAGFYESRSRAACWDGRNEVGEPVASGLYFYVLKAGDFSATRKMLIRK